MSKVTVSEESHTANVRTVGLFVGLIGSYTETFERFGAPDIENGDFSTTSCANVAEVIKTRNHSLRPS